MNAAVLFIDRDGTLIEEPADEQIDSLGKVRFMPGVFAALSALTARGYRLVMVTNQDGLGTPSFLRAAFDEAQQFILDTFASQGITFDAVFVCPHRLSEGCSCRKPRTGLLTAYLREHAIDSQRSAVIGDRATDLELAANLGVRGFTVRRHGGAHETWPAVAAGLLARRAQLKRHTNETRIEVSVNLDAVSQVKVATGIGFFDHMLEQLAKHGGFSLELTAVGDLH